MRVKMKTTMCGPNGTVHAGAAADVDEVTAAALVDGGFAEALEPFAAAAPAAPAIVVDGVVIPEEWRTMPAKALKALADQFVDEPVKTRNEAISTIEVVLAARGDGLFAAAVETASLAPPETAAAPPETVDE